MLAPQLPLTVERDFWDEMARSTSQEFADSYLSGADCYQDRLMPKTQTAWKRIKDSAAAMACLHRLKIELRKPPIFTRAEQGSSRQPYSQR